MSCSTNTLLGISLDCPGIAGVSAVYIVKKENLASVTFSTLDLISGITMVSDEKFLQYNFRRGNANFTSEGQKNDKNNTGFFTTTLNLQFNRQENSKRSELMELFKSEVFIIVKDNNGEYYLIGYDKVMEGYASVTTLSTATGAEATDGNMYTLVISSQTGELPYHVTPSVISTII